VSDYISDQLRVQAASLLDSISEQARSMLPGWPGSSPEHVAAVRAEQKAKAERQQVVATAEWEAVCAKVPSDLSGVVLLEVLGRHQPQVGQFAEGPSCSSCYEGSYEAEPTEWPCETFEVVRDGLGADAPD
jgi:hypothetical protein